MNYAYRTVIFKFICIVVFTIIYWNLGNQFSGLNNRKLNLIDFIALSTTIEAGVGITDLQSTSSLIQIILTVQQLIIICTTILLIFFLTRKRFI